MQMTKMTANYGCFCSADRCLSLVLWHNWLVRRLASWIWMLYKILIGTDMHLYRKGERYTQIRRRYNTRGRWSADQLALRRLEEFVSKVRSDGWLITIYSLIMPSESCISTLSYASLIFFCTCQTRLGTFDWVICGQTYNNHNSL
jgi:hypothetical protein